VVIKELLEEKGEIEKRVEVARGNEGLAD